MNKQRIIGTISLIAGLVLFTLLCGPGMHAQVSTGGFRQGPSLPTLQLVNDTTRLTDWQLANIANAITGKHRVELATRWAGQCIVGGWCLSITDELLGSAVTPEGMGAAVADAVRTEIQK